MRARPSFVVASVLSALLGQALLALSPATAEGAAVTIAQQAQLAPVPSTVSDHESARLAEHQMAVASSQRENPGRASASDAETAETAETTESTAELTVSLDRQTISIDDPPAQLSIGLPQAPGDTVTVALAGQSHDVTLDDAGEGALTLTGLGVGEHEIVVDYAGSETVAEARATATLNVVEMAGTVAADDVEVRLALDQAVLAVYFVGVPSGAAPPTGVVQAWDGGELLVDGELVDGEAALVLPALAVGSHDLIVSYGGDGRFAASSGAVGVTVARAPSEISALWPEEQAFGSIDAGIEVVVAVDGDAAPGASLPEVTGQVELLVDGDVAATVDLAAGSAYLALPADLAQGGHDLTVRYLGSEDLAAAEASGAVHVAAVPTTLNITGGAATTYGEIVEIGIDVSAAHGAAPGSVRASTDTLLATEPLIGGRAVLTVDTRRLGVGQHTIEIAYAGGGGYAPSSGTHALTVGLAPAVLTVTRVASASADAVLDLHVGVDAEVAPSEGTVVEGTVIEGTVVAESATGPDVSAALADGDARLQIPSSIDDGEHTYTVRYSGMDGMLAAVEETVTFVVQRGPGLAGPAQLSLDADGPLLPGGEYEVTASGLLPTELVHGYLYSDPAYLGLAIADTDGAAGLVFTVPPDAGSGEHRLEVRSSGGVSSLSVTVAGPPSQDGSGSDGAVDEAPAEEAEDHEAESTNGSSASVHAQTGVDPLVLIGVAVIALGLVATVFGGWSGGGDRS